MHLDVEQLRPIVLGHGIAVKSEGPLDGISYSLLVRFDDANGQFTTHCRSSTARHTEAVIDALFGSHTYQARNLASAIGLPAEAWPAWSALCQAAFACFSALDATDLYLGPLAFSSGEGFSVHGAWANIDDRAYFRHPFTPSETANRSGRWLTYAGGSIGVIANGAGLLMAAADALADNGLKAGALIEFEVVPSLALLGQAAVGDADGADGLFLTFFADAFSAVHLAEAIISLSQLEQLPPLVIRLSGQDANSARALLSAHHLPCASTYDEAAKSLQRRLNRSD